MFDRLRRHLLVWLRLRPAPQAPFGAPGSVRVFRAGTNFYRLCLLGWAGAQVATLLGLIVSLSFAQTLRESVRETRDPGASNRRGASGKISPPDDLVRTFAQGPRWLPAGIVLFEAGAVLVYLIALPATYAAVRLDYEQRWYAVTDRSLRIRTGLLNTQEMTMSFANLQQVVVVQGPLQRLFGVADVRVRSAGGGVAGEGRRQKQEEASHTGVFRGVDNAAEIRDLILERLRHFREAGLGDPDEKRSQAVLPPDALEAARNLLDEARALRRTLSS